MEIRHILLLRAQSTQIAMCRSGQGRQIPSVTLPRGTRTAAALTAWVRQELGIDSLYLGHGESSAQFALLETTEVAPSLHAGWSWTDAPPLLLAVFSQQESRSHQRHPWTQRGWWSVFRPWAQAVLSEAGLAWDGRVDQHNGGHGELLLYLPCSPRAAWFKCGNRAEYSVTSELYHRYPDVLPSHLGTCCDWAGWLMLDSNGAPLWKGSEAQWVAAVQTLAQIQRQEADRCDSWLALGCQDLRPSHILANLDPLMDGLSKVAQRQPSEPPVRITAQTLAEVRRIAVRVLARASGYPASLLHADPNPGNILAAGKTCHILDWADAAFGHPLVTFDRLLGHARRAGLGAFQNQLFAAYSEAWGTTSRLAGPLGSRPFARAVRLVTDLFLKAWWLHARPCALPREVVDKLLRSLCRSILTEVSHEEFA